MEKGNKMVSIYDWGNKKKQEAIINILTKLGHEPTQENISMMEYEIDFTEDIQNDINELNLDELVRKECAVAYKYHPEKIELMFPDKDKAGCLVEFEIYVDLKGQLQTKIRTFKDFVRDSESSK